MSKWDEQILVVNRKELFNNEKSILSKNMQHMQENNV